MEKLATSSWRGLEPARSGLWLVIDIVDDLRDRYDDPNLLAALQEIRNGALDLLHEIRKLERGVVS